MLASDLTTLARAGTPDIVLVAHSIGGLVGKGAIDQLSRTGAAGTFTRLDLHAFGTPWGGFALLEVAMKVPGSIALSKFFRYPMAPELRPSSRFLASLAAPMPPNGELHLYVGTDDGVAQPDTAAARQRYAELEAQARTVTELDGVRHNDYNRLVALTNEVKGTRPGPACTRLPCRLAMHVSQCAATALATAALPGTR